MIYCSCDSFSISSIFIAKKWKKHIFEIPFKIIKAFTILKLCFDKQNVDRNFVYMYLLYLLLLALLWVQVELEALELEAIYHRWTTIKINVFTCKQLACRTQTEARLIFWGLSIWCWVQWVTGCVNGGCIDDHWSKIVGEFWYFWISETWCQK